MKNQFYITVNDRTVTAETPRVPIVAGSTNTYECVFCFDESWNGLIKSVIFDADGKCIGVPLSDLTSCDIPWEVLRYAGEMLRVGVFGTTADGKSAKPTLWCELGRIHDGAGEAFPGGEAPDTYTSKIEMIAKRAADSAKDAENARDKAVVAKEDADNSAQNSASFAVSAAQSKTKAEEAADVAKKGKEMILSLFKSPKAISYVCRYGLANKFFSIDDRFYVDRARSLKISIGTSVGITSADLNEEIWLMHEGTVGSGTYCFFFNGNGWLFGGEPVSLADYGITVTGLPILHDEIIVTEIADSVEMCVADIDENGKYVSFVPARALMSVSFDEQEAIYYCENGLAAGTYNFSLPSGYEESYSEGWTAFSFTLKKDVPAGGQLVLLWDYQTPISYGRIASYSSPYANNASEYVFIRSGTEGTSLGTISRWGKITGNINNILRARYGSNIYKTSAIRQYINSTAKKGEWWHPTGKFDRVPSYLNYESGLLHGIDAEVLSVLSDQTYTSCLPRATLGTDEPSVTLTDKVVIPAKVEVFGSDENTDVSEGKALPLFAENSSLALPGTDADRGRIIKDIYGNACSVWLRTAERATENNAYVILSDGSINRHHVGRNFYSVMPVFRIGNAA